MGHGTKNREGGATLRKVLPLITHPHMAWGPSTTLWNVAVPPESGLRDYNYSTMGQRLSVCLWLPPPHFVEVRGRGCTQRSTATLPRHRHQAGVAIYSDETRLSNREWVWLIIMRISVNIVQLQSPQGRPAMNMPMAKKYNIIVLFTEVGVQQLTCANRH